MMTMRTLLISLLMLVGCASLERGGDDAPPSIDPTPDAGVIVPDSPAPPDACEPDSPPPPPPPCSCDDDCDDGEKCHSGVCYERCDCNEDCDAGESCRYGLCKPNH